MKTLTKRRNIVVIILVLMLALPLSNILFTCCYVMFNKNAFESFANGVTLSSAFEYALSEFVTANNFGKLDFFTWFSSAFLDNTVHDLIYIHFINWYLNYCLYVSISYLLFSVLFFSIIL